MGFLWEKFVKDESGATAIEYAFIAALIALAIVAALQDIANALNGVFSNVGNKL